MLLLAVVCMTLYTCDFVLTSKPLHVSTSIRIRNVL